MRVFATWPDLFAAFSFPISIEYARRFFAIGSREEFVVSGWPAGGAIEGVCRDVGESYDSPYSTNGVQLSDVRPFSVVHDKRAGLNARERSEFYVEQTKRWLYGLCSVMYMEGRKAVMRLVRSSIDTEVRHKLEEGRARSLLADVSVFLSSATARTDAGFFRFVLGWSRPSTSCIEKARIPTINEEPDETVTDEEELLRYHSPECPIPYLLSRRWALGGKCMICMGWLRGRCRHQLVDVSDTSPTTVLSPASVRAATLRECCEPAVVVSESLVVDTPSRTAVATATAAAAAAPASSAMRLPAILSYDEARRRREGKLKRLASLSVPRSGIVSGYDPHWGIDEHGNDYGLVLSYESESLAKARLHASREEAFDRKEKEARLRASGDDSFDGKKEVTDMESVIRQLTRRSRTRKELVREERGLSSDERRIMRTSGFADAMRDGFYIRADKASEECRFLIKEFLRGVDSDVVADRSGVARVLDRLVSDPAGRQFVFSGTVIQSGMIHCHAFDDVADALRALSPSNLSTSASTSPVYREGQLFGLMGLDLSRVRRVASAISALCLLCRCSRRTGPKISDLSCQSGYKLSGISSLDGLARQVYVDVVYHIPAIVTAVYVLYGATVPCMVISRMMYHDSRFGAEYAFVYDSRSAWMEHINALVKDVGAWLKTSRNSEGCCYDLLADAIERSGFELDSSSSFLFSPEAIGVYYSRHIYSMAVRKYEQISSEIAACQYKAAQLKTGLQATKSLFRDARMRRINTRFWRALSSACDQKIHELTGLQGTSQQLSTSSEPRRAKVQHDGQVQLLLRKLSDLETRIPPLSAKARAALLSSFAPAAEDNWMQRWYQLHQLPDSIRQALRLVRYHSQSNQPFLRLQERSSRAVCRVFEQSGLFNSHINTPLLAPLDDASRPLFPAAATGETAVDPSFDPLDPLPCPYYAKRERMQSLPSPVELRSEPAPRQCPEGGSDQTTTLCGQIRTFCCVACDGKSQTGCWACMTPVIFRSCVALSCDDDEPTVQPCKDLKQAASYTCELCKRPRGGCDYCRLPGVDSTRGRFGLFCGLCLHLSIFVDPTPLKSTTIIKNLKPLSSVATAAAAAAASPAVISNEDGDSLSLT